MKLLDAAEVKNQARGTWEHGWEGDSRVCSGIHVYLSECDPDATSDVLGTDEFESADCGFRIIPFGIVAELDRKTISSRPDDADWLAKALRDSAEIPVARGLLVRQGMGAQLGDTWIGSASAHQITAPTLTDGVALGDAIGDGRREFFSRTLGIQPILHVNPDFAPLLSRNHVILIDPETKDITTVWGDPVVISEGYYDIPGMTPTLSAFWTGPLSVTLSEVNDEEVIQMSRMNRQRYQVTMLAAIDTAPCAIIRIGAAPASAG